MSSTTPETPEPKKKPTQAGNYFISNYPPFSFWSADQNERVQEALESECPEGTPLGIYLHIPFCRKRCHFCYFKVYTDKNAGEIRGYLDKCIEELEYLAKQTRISGRKPKFVYFGGGTPSYLSEKQLIELTDKMKEILPWDEIEEVAFEGEPGTLTPRKLAAIKRVGVTRISLGIENFDDHILDLNGRAHKSKEVYTAFAAAREEGFDQINIDLIAGMLDETDENWQRNIDETLKLRPDSITVYQMEVPYNTGIYKEMKASGALNAPVADWDTKRRWTREAFAAFEEAGYTISSGYTAVLNPERTKFVYRDELWCGADLIGVGVSSFSHVAGVHYQNITEINQYIEAIGEGRLPTTRSLRTTEEERMIREFILQMKLGHVSAEYFQTKFSVNIIDKFRSQLEELSGNGMLKFDENEILLERSGLLCVDNLLHGFFLSHHKTDRIV